MCRQLLEWPDIIELILVKLFEDDHILHNKVSLFLDFFSLRRVEACYTYKQWRTQEWNWLGSKTNESVSAGLRSRVLWCQRAHLTNTATNSLLFFYVKHNFNMFFVVSGDPTPLHLGPPLHTSVSTKAVNESFKASSRLTHLAESGKFDRSRGVKRVWSMQLDSKRGWIYSSRTDLWLVLVVSS